MIIIDEEALRESKIPTLVDSTNYACPDQLDLSEDVLAELQVPSCSKHSQVLFENWRDAPQDLFDTSRCRDVERIPLLAADQTVRETKFHPGEVL